MEQEMLHKIDTIRQRLGVSYREATEALHDANGDLLEALMRLEEERLPVTEKIHHLKDGAIDQIKGLIHKGNNTKIKIKNDEGTLVEFPATWGAIGLIGSMMRTEIAFVGLVATATAIAKGWDVDLVQEGTQQTMEPEIDGFY